ncbi:MAG: hypothetical protein IIT72_08880, partial [Lachnospiraceae bacterium]|nr:hypothetical protein [Lachnospiraceae bacterium]
PQGKAFRCSTVAKVPLASKLADGTLARCYTKKALLFQQKRLCIQQYKKSGREDPNHFFVMTLL